MSWHGHPLTLPAIFALQWILTWVCLAVPPAGCPESQDQRPFCTRVASASSTALGPARALSQCRLQALSSMGNGWHLQQDWGSLATCHVERDPTVSQGPINPKPGRK